MKITLNEWESKGDELFGSDKKKWEFVCPACETVMSIDIARAKFPHLKGKGWAPNTECIGRYDSAHGCDWCAYGLFSGPVIVETADGKGSPTFDFAGSPFSGREY